MDALPVQHEWVEVLRKGQVPAVLKPAVQNQHYRWLWSQPEHRHAEADFNFRKTLSRGQQKTGGAENPNRKLEQPDSFADEEEEKCIQYSQAEQLLSR